MIRKRRWDSSTSPTEEKEPTLPTGTIPSAVEGKVSKKESPSKDSEADTKKASILEVLGFKEDELEDTKKKETAHKHKSTIDINDTRYRYHLMKAASIRELEDEFGVSVVVKGKYYPDRTLAAKEGEQPLFLEVGGDDMASIEATIDKIKKLMEIGPATLPSISGPLVQKVFMPFDVETLLAQGVQLRQKIVGPQVLPWPHCLCCV